MDVITMFPQPLFVERFSEVDNNLVSKELKKLDYYSIDNNTTIIKSSKSKTNNLLDMPQFKTLWMAIQAMGNKVNHNYIQSTTELELVESWATKTEPGGVGDVHYHTSTFLSGVYYPGEGAKIVFSNKRYAFDTNQHPEPEFKTRNTWNSTDWSIDTHHNFCLLFYSTTDHQLAYNDSKDDRYSIAFNFVPAYKGKFNDVSKDKIESIEKRRKTIYGV